MRREIARVWPSSRISIRIYLGSVISRTRADLCYISCRTLSNTPKDNRLLRRNNLPMYDKLVSPERSFPPRVRSILSTVHRQATLNHN